MPPVYRTLNANTPAIIAGDGAAAVTVLASNPARMGFSIQNVGTTAAKICFGTATTSVFHFVLKGGSQDNDGTGGSITYNTGTIYTGLITVFGATTAKLVVLEQAP